MVAARNQAAVRWRTTGTFCGGPFQGIEPTGARVELEGIDLLTVEDGLIQRNDAYYDGAAVRARRSGCCRRATAGAERRMAAAFNARTRLLRSLFKPNVEQVADGVWVVQGGFPLKTMNVYLIEDERGVTVFDAGIRAMTNGIASAAARHGRIKRVVLGHGHADHRGAAPGLGAPVCCHPDDVADARGRRRRALLRLLASSTGTRAPSMPRLLKTLGRRPGEDRRAPSARATRSPASRWSTSPATRPG